MARKALGERGGWVVKMGLRSKSLVGVSLRKGIKKEFAKTERNVRSNSLGEDRRRNEA